MFGWWKHWHISTALIADTISCILFNSITTVKSANYAPSKYVTLWKKFRQIISFIIWRIISMISFSKYPSLALHRSKERKIFSEWKQVKSCPVLTRIDAAFKVIFFGKTQLQITWLPICSNLWARISILIGRKFQKIVPKIWWTALKNSKN